ncbi:hypothetical protein M409DRAFT_27277 [Zasmidium cellare ATCC 36951]|uniref:Uncharacterized protein n=1 Tax=Zasmidium cellare ATCC 36951 TaxID=1080233 RepID=A0A6A6C595_ZASCE|nr:uncharacterized protein M409DRAFT_27277 [Zasmidium cellare ATCC 36951]KAF2162274.1 hypothetical protein M409DRAFT_27277 [Zasmidium cellare ATCC 36951]
MSHEKRLAVSSRSRGPSNGRRGARPAQTGPRPVEEQYRVHRGYPPHRHARILPANDRFTPSHSPAPSGPRAVPFGAPLRRQDPPRRRRQGPNQVTSSRLIIPRASDLRELLRSSSAETISQIRRNLHELQDEVSSHVSRSPHRSNWSTDAWYNFANAMPGMIIETPNFEPLGDPRSNPVGSNNRTETPNGPIFCGVHPPLIVDKHKDINGNKVLTVAWCGTYGGRASELIELLKGTPDYEAVAFIVAEDGPVPEEIPRGARVFKAHTFETFLRDEKRYTLVDFRKVGLVYCQSGMRCRGRILGSEKDEILNLAHHRPVSSSSPTPPTQDSSPDHQPKSKLPTEDTNAAGTPVQVVSTAANPSDMTRLAQGLNQTGMDEPTGELPAGMSDQGAPTGELSEGFGEQGGEGIF